MLGTALVYSSHNRSNYLHDHFIVQRALRGPGNKRILFLPMSETVQNGSELERQEFSWGTFRWYFDFYAKYGLEYFPFYWRSNLRKEDVDALWHQLYDAEVVIRQEHRAGGADHAGRDTHDRHDPKHGGQPADGPASQPPGHECAGEPDGHRPARGDRDHLHGGAVHEVSHR